MEWPLFYSGLPNYYAHIVALYDRQRAHSFVLDFARLSLQFAHSRSSFALTGDADADAAMIKSARTEMLSRLFAAATALSRFDAAHTALLAMGREEAPALQQACLRFLVEKMAETGQVAAMVALPFPGRLADAVDAVLLQKCHAAMEVLRGTQWHQILYAWRIARNDYRGAAAILLDRLQKLQQAGEGDKFSTAPVGGGLAVGLPSEDVLDTPVTRQYLMLINTLSCVEPKQAWIYTEDLSLRPSGLRGSDGEEIRTSVEGGDDDEEEQTATTAPLPPRPSSRAKTAVSGSEAMRGLIQKAAAAPREPWRKVVTLADIRKQYQAELDRIAAIQNNQFGFGEADEDDVSMGGL